MRNNLCPPAAPFFAYYRQPNRAAARMAAKCIVDYMIWQGMDISVDSLTDERMSRILERMTNELIINVHF